MVVSQKIEDDDFTVSTAKTTSSDKRAAVQTLQKQTAVGRRYDQLTSAQHLDAQEVEVLVNKMKTTQNNVRVTKQVCWCPLKLSFFCDLLFFLFCLFPIVSRWIESGSIAKRLLLLQSRIWMFSSFENLPLISRSISRTNEIFPRKRKRDFARINNSDYIRL